VWELIAAQVLHIAADSVDNALAWESRLDTAIFNLSDTHGHAVDEGASKRLGVEVRKFVFERTYLVHYTLDKPACIVRVIGFRHGARLPNPHEP
jgi:plasmid stabilization system protein ParE